LKSWKLSKFSSPLHIGVAIYSNQFPSCDQNVGLAIEYRRQPQSFLKEETLP
jgi:hypothetical protein